MLYRWTATSFAVPVETDTSVPMILTSSTLKPTQALLFLRLMCADCKLGVAMDRFIAG